jgi:hypothetical protein
MMLRGLEKVLMKERANPPATQGKFTLFGAAVAAIGTSRARRGAPADCGRRDFRLSPLPTFVKHVR